MKKIKIFLENPDTYFFENYLQTKVISTINDINIRVIKSSSALVFFEFEKNGTKYYCWRNGVIGDYTEVISDAINDLGNNRVELTITDRLYDVLSS